MQQYWKSISGIVGSVSGVVALYILLRDGWFTFVYLTQGEVTSQAQNLFLCLVIQLAAMGLGLAGFIQAKRLGKSHGVVYTGMIVPLVLTIAVLGFALILVVLMAAVDAFFGLFRH